VDTEATIGEADRAVEVSAGAHESVVLRLASLGRLVRHALPSVLEGAVGPMTVFYLVLVLFGFRGALIAAALWSCLAAARGLVRRERLPDAPGSGVPAAQSEDIDRLPHRQRVPLLPPAPVRRGRECSRPTDGVRQVALREDRLGPTIVSRLVFDREFRGKTWSAGVLIGSASTRLSLLAFDEHPFDWLDDPTSPDGAELVARPTVDRVVRTETVGGSRCCASQGPAGGAAEDKSSRPKSR
jgi:hypothetical protein